MREVNLNLIQNNAVRENGCLFKQIKKKIDSSTAVYAKMWWKPDYFMNELQTEKKMF